MTEPIRVLSVISSLGIGGDENRLVSIVQSMDKQRFAFSVVLLPQSPGVDERTGNIRSSLEAAGVSVQEIFDPPTPRWFPHIVQAAIRWIGNCLTVAKIIRQSRTQVVDARLEQGGIMGTPAALLCHVPSMLTLYDANPPVKYPLWQLARGMILNLTNAVITDNTVRRSELRRWVRRRSTSFWIIPTGVPAPRPRHAASEVRDLLGLPAASTAKVVCQIARIVPYKGHMVLLDAAKIVLRAEPETYFIFIGYPGDSVDYLQQLRQAIAESGIAHRIRLQGYPGAVGDIWQIVDIHVHASLFDSLPTAILEGMSLAKPAVVTAVGGIPEAVTHNETGLVVPPGQAEPLAAAILELLRDPQKAAALGTAAQALYLAQYQPAAMVSELDRCITSLCSRSM